MLRVSVRDSIALSSHDPSTCSSSQLCWMLRAALGLPGLGLLPLHLRNTQSGFPCLPPHRTLVSLLDCHCSLHISSIRSSNWIQPALTEHLYLLPIQKWWQDSPGPHQALPTSSAHLSWAIRIAQNSFIYLILTPCNIPTIAISNINSPPSPPTTLLPL